MMKRLTSVALLAGALCLPALAAARSVTVALNVPTMDCSTCPITIRAALMKTPGVLSARVSYKTREAVVVFDDARVSVDELKKATANAGYPSYLKSSLP